MKKKVGILTYHKSFNYGALLQVFATQKIVEKLGHEGFVVNYENKDEKKENTFLSYKKGFDLKRNLKDLIRNIFLKSYSIRKNNFSKFSNNLKKTVIVTDGGEINSKLDYIDIFMAGSDQIWNPEINGGKFDDVFLLDFTSKKKISYASSSGSHKFTSEEQEYLKKVLSTFNNISVRESYLQKELKKIGFKNVNLVLDPTLLFTREQWKIECYDEDILKSVPEKYILVYILEPFNNFCKEQIKNLKQIYGLKTVNVGFSTRKKEGIDINLTNVTPERFVALIANATLIVTDSFHGTAFSVNFNKDFFAILNPSNPIRVQNFLENLKLENRILSDIKNKKSDKSKVIYDYANKILIKEREDSIEYLKKAIEIR